MIGLDTNVLVRYLVQDDPAQSATATTVIQGLCDAGDSLFLNGVVLCELVWVLESGYGHSRSSVADVIEKLLLTRQFEVEDRDTTWRALAAFQRGKADFADYLIGARNLAADCEHTLTFDGALKGETGFELM